MEKIKTIFIGTSNFAVPILEAISKMEFVDLVAIVTQPDRPVGRKQVLTAPPVKLCAISYELSADILQPESIRKSSNEIIEKYQPELIIVASYGQIIPRSMIDYPKYGSLNIHVSLLPKLRGAVPMPMAILLGLKETGVTLQKMTYELDEGDIVSSRKIQIAKDETFETLEKKSAEKSVEMLNEDLEKWLKGEIKAIPQNHSEATYCYTSDISKDKAEIKFETDIYVAERMTRAFYPWPIAWVKLKDGKMLKIYKATISNQLSVIGSQSDRLQILKQGKSLFLALRNGAIELNEVQLESKSRDISTNYLYLAENKTEN